MQLWIVLSHISATNFTCTYIRIHVSLCVMLLHFHWHSWLLEFLVGHIIAPIMCSRVLCVMIFLLAFLALELLLCHIIALIMRSHAWYVTMLPLVLLVIIILVLCVVCTHVYTSIPGSRVPNSLSHDINTRGATPAKCVISLSLSILALGFPAKRLMILTRGISPLCSVSLNFHCQSRLHDPSEFYS